MPLVECFYFFFGIEPLILWQAPVTAAILVKEFSLLQDYTWITTVSVIKCQNKLVFGQKKIKQNTYKIEKLVMVVILGLFTRAKQKKQT